MGKYNKKKITSIALLLFFLVLIVYGLEFSVHARKAVQLTRESKAFSVENPTASVRILVVGDSTAVGTGAENPLLSVAGRFHQDFPDAEIVNFAHNGAQAEDVLQQVQTAEGRFDLIVIHSGANDILYFTPLRRLLATTQELLLKALELGDTVVLITSGDVGLSPAFTPPINRLYSRRSAEVLPRLAALSEELGVLFVDLYSVSEEDLPIPDFKRYLAPDFIHLNGEGYGVWYRLIRETMNMAGVTEL